MAKTTFRPLNFKLLLEGIPTPFCDITVTDAINVPSSAVISIPFSLLGKYIRPRTTVLIFFKYEDIKDMPYNLFFFGEVGGIAHMRRGEARMLQLKCVSLSNYLNSSYISFIQTAEHWPDIAYNKQSSGSIVTKQVGQSADILAQMLGKDGNSDLPGYIRSLLTLLWKSSYAPDAFVSKYAAYKMKDRFVTLPADMLSSFLSGIGIGPLRQMVLSTVQRMTTIAEHLSVVKSIAMMDYVENRSLARQNFYFKPILNYGIPPRCNMIFPCQYESFTFQEDFLKAPTRLFYKVGNPISKSEGSGETNVLSPEGMSPYELSKAYEASQAGSAKSSMFYTAEEAERGVIPYEGSEQWLDNAWFQSLWGAKPDSKDAAAQQAATMQYREKLQQWQDFKFFYLKSKFKQLDLAECSFMPQLMCGFPAAVLDPQGFYLGYLESVTHNINSAGRAATRMNLTNIRDVTDPVLGRPWWFKDFTKEENSYGIQRAGSEVYEPMLGCDSMIETEEFINAIKEASPEHEKRLFSDAMIGLTQPKDVFENWRDLCHNQLVQTSVFEDTFALQKRMFASMTARFLDYQRALDKFSYVENYTFRPASSLHDFVKQHAEYITTADDDTERLAAGEIVPLRNAPEAVEITMASANNSETRTITPKFFRNTNQNVVLNYVNSLNKIQIDTDLYGDPALVFPSAAPAGDTKTLTTAPFIAPGVDSGELQLIRTEGPKVLETYYNAPKVGAAQEFTTSTTINPLRDSSAVTPLAGKYRISSEFGGRVHPIYKVWKHHNGVDIPAAAGTPVRAVKPGVATVRKNVAGYGNMVVVRHDDGTTTRYAHLSSFAVGTNTRVEAGQHIGGVGNTGRSKGNHLHFECMDKTGKFVDPRKVIDFT